jgi:MFS family permease
MALKLGGALKSDEQKQVLLMLIAGFFMGVFISVYQVTADSLFLNRLGEYLDKAFLVAGALGIVTTALFTTFQNWMKFTTLVLTSFALIFIFTLSVYLTLRFGDGEYERLLLFTLYCMTGPITAVMLLSFWGTFGRLFNFRQSKRIIGWIDTGQLIAAIAATFSIPLTAALIPKTMDYLVLCLVSILLALIIMVVISFRFSFIKNDPREFSRTVRKQTKLSAVFSDPYILLLSAFLMVSMLTFVLSQYSFQELVKEQYPNQRELTDFVAFFTGSVYILSLLMQTFVNNRIIKNYGLKISLFLMPFIVGIFVLGSLSSGFILGYDKVGSPTGFVYFFLFISLSRLFNWTVRDSLENPVFKLFFIPLDSSIRFSIQTKVEGLANESARFLAGLLIFVFAFIPFFRIIHIPVLILVCVGLYFLVVSRMYNGYRAKIRAKLESSDVQVTRLEKGFDRVISRLEKMLAFPQPSRAVFSFKLLEKINAANMPTWVNTLMKNEDDLSRHYAQERMNEIKGLSVSDKYVIRMDESVSDGSERNVISKGELRMMLESGGDITKSRIQKLSRSRNPDDRHYAAELLLHTSRDESISFLIELLSDNEAKVRNTAIKTSTKKYNQEVINSLIENMGNPVYSNQAMHALTQIGADALNLLESAFYRSGQTTQVMLRIVQTVGRIGGQRSKEMLWAKMDYPDKVVVSQVLLSLGECGFKAGISQISRIKYVIEADIADIRWNLSAIQEIGDEGFADQIKKSLRWEIQNDIEHIYMLLAMLYDTRSIQLVKENIDTGSTEEITYAIELLDVFLSEQLKQRVIPILDDLTDNERIGRLDDYYPRVKLDARLVLKFMINRDFTQANRWTKACILFQIGTQQLNEFKMDLIAQLFNPDPLIKEISAWALYQLDVQGFEENVARLNRAQQKDLRDLIVHNRRMTIFEKVLFFQRISIFENIPGITLSYLGDISEELRLDKGASLLLDESGNNNDFYVITSGSVKFFQKGKEVGVFKEGQFVGEMLASQQFINTNLMVAQTDVIALKFNKDQFYEILSDNVELADKILEHI